MRRRTRIRNTINICCWITALLLVSLLSLMLINQLDRNNLLMVHHRSPSIEFSEKLLSANLAINSANSQEAPPNFETVQKTTIKPIEIESKPKQISTNKQIKKHQKPSKFAIHFIHIPKCGGTTMTAILREIQCNLDANKFSDCCINPGFCDWHAKRRCVSIQGCTNHFPNRPAIFQDLPSIAVFRNPISRLLSAWFYRGHSPNNDFFQVRPYFKEIREGLRPKVVFAEYLEMHEYQNIVTRMLGADSFPYRDIKVTDEVYERALEALNNLFFIGLQEDFEISTRTIIRELNATVTPTIKKERDQGNTKISKQKQMLKENSTLMERAREVNSYDIKLYDEAVKKFCQFVGKYTDLMLELQNHHKIKCD